MLNLNNRLKLFLKKNKIKLCGVAMTGVILVSSTACNSEKEVNDSINLYAFKNKLQNPDNIIEVKEAIYNQKFGYYVTIYETSSIPIYEIIDDEATISDYETTTSSELFFVSYDDIEKIEMTEFLESKKSYIKR